jgi:sec-independent protein translocase protein TatA
MFGIGMPELGVILVVALVVLGPKRLPDAARAVGRAVAEFRRQSADVMDDLRVQLEQDESRPQPPKPAPPDEAPEPRDP